MYEFQGVKQRQFSLTAIVYQVRMEKKTQLANE